MKSDYELMARAFQSLESLPENIAFEILRKLDALTQFPEMGTSLEVRFPKLKDYRELLYKRSIRIIYQFDAYDNMIYVVAIQNCRQKLPSARDLKRDSSTNKELPLE